MAEVYYIPAVNMERLKEEVVKLNRKADKNGCSRVELKIIKTVKQKKKDLLLGFEYDFVLHHCVIEGEAPIIEGWKLIAIAEPQPNAEMLIREMPGEVCPAFFRTTDLMCDHCGYRRKRNSVFILREKDFDEDGNRGYKQVGKNCLRDFLNGVSPAAMLAAAEHIIDFGNMASAAEKEEWGQGKGKLQRTLPVDQFVAMASVLIRKLGWVPRSKVNDYDQSENFRSNKTPTADLAWNLVSYPHVKENKKFIEENKIVVEGRDLDIADAAVEWATTINPDTAENTYLHDLGVSCRQAYVTWKTHGFVASVINAYQKELASRNKSNTTYSCGNFLGRVNDEIQLLDAKVVLAKQFNGKYLQTLVKFISPEGNVLVWWASGSPDWIELNKMFNIRGTVVDHKEYNGEKQTVLKYVKPIQVNSTAVA